MPKITIEKACNILEEFHQFIDQQMEIAIGVDSRNVHDIHFSNLGALSREISHIILTHFSLGYIEEGQQEAINMAIRLMNPTMVNNDPAIHSGCLGFIWNSIAHFFHIEPIPGGFSGVAEDHH